MASGLVNITGKDINSVSPDIRDFLLKKNLLPSDSILKSSYVNNLSGIGKQAQVSTNTSVIDTPDLEETGEQYRNLITSSNSYIPDTFSKYNVSNPTDSTINSLSNLDTPISGYKKPTDDSESFLSTKGDDIRKNTIKFNLYSDSEQQTKVDLSGREVRPNQKLGAYIDNEFNLNIGDSSAKQAGDILGTILRGGGVGFDTSGKPVTSFDLRSSLANRVLGDRRIANDTPIGIIGAQQLVLHLQNNIGFNLQQETIGRINKSPLSILAGAEVIVPNYTISVPRSGIGKSVDFISRILGFELPVSIIGRDASIFDDDHDNIPNNIIRNNALISYTGKGQRVALFFNLNKNKDNDIKGRKRYRPQYEDNGTIKVAGDYYIAGGNDGQFKFSLDEEEVTLRNNNEILKNKQLKASENGWGSPDSEIDWRRVNINPFNKKTLLHKTQELANRGRIWKSNSISDKAEKSEVQKNPIFTGDGFIISKGNATRDLSGNFCRVWTKTRKYEKVSNLQRHRGLYSFGSNERINTNKSVLDNNGFPKIAPYKEDDIVEAKELKKYMFSIENLAWSDSSVFDSLPPCEVGNGDPITKKRGRIMWFPPYDISFDESANVDLDITKFIGRGEPIYTYNNTERIGHLRFKIIVDHPSVMNTLIKTENEESLRRFIIGCEDIPKSVLNKITKAQETNIAIKTVTDAQKSSDNNNISGKFRIYFDNASSDVGEITTSPFCDNSNADFYESGEGGLNFIFFSGTGEGSLTQIIKDLNDCEFCKINLVGHSTKHGRKEENEQITSERIAAVKNFLISEGVSADKFAEEKLEIETGPEPDTKLDPPPIETCELRFKEHRVVIGEYKYSAINNPNNNAKPTIIDEQSEQKLSEEFVSLFINECEYFEKLEQESPLVFNNLKTKIRFFHPAFHSITPEGLNSRLTFLHQCTRQGPTNAGIDKPNNLAFGRPPVCILRIGDFYHTKIFIDSMNISFDPLIWDLNPEGIGLQPMIADVDLSFRFIGGSSLSGPISELQNAVSFNFFANSEIYEPRSVTIDVNGNQSRRFKVETEKPKINPNQDNSLGEEPNKPATNLEKIV